jgi:hypothetical protein
MTHADQPEDHDAGAARRHALVQKPHRQQRGPGRHGEFQREYRGQRQQGQAGRPGILRNVMDDVAQEVELHAPRTRERTQLRAHDHQHGQDGQYAGAAHQENFENAEADLGQRANRDRQHGEGQQGADHPQDGANDIAFSHGLRCR